MKTVLALLVSMVFLLPLVARANLVPWSEGDKCPEGDQCKLRDSKWGLGESEWGRCHNSICVSDASTRACGCGQLASSSIGSDAFALVLASSVSLIFVKARKRRHIVARNP